MGTRHNTHMIHPGPGGCWLWGRSVNSDGYAIWRKRDENRHRRVHVVFWEAFNGPVPEGKELDHLCRVRCCINPAHLEPVSSAENTRRGNGITAMLGKKTHCVNGHAFEGNNLIVRNAAGWRRCAQCNRERMKRNYWRKRRGEEEGA